MRKTLMLAALAALSVCGVAYAATTTTTQYFVDKSTSLKPVKAGTKKAPVSESLHLVYGEKATPSTQRPAIAKADSISYQDMRENTNAFKACGSSTLVQSGPSACPKGSQVGKGYFIGALSSTANSTVLTTCRADVTLFNGGNHTVVIYVYKAAAPTTQKPAECPLSTTYAIIAKFHRAGANLVQSFTVPNSLRHQTIGAASFDIAVLNVSVDVPAKSLVLTTHAHGKTVKHRVGFLESFGCPTNHQRQIAVTSTPESGAPRTATQLVGCK